MEKPKKMVLVEADFTEMADEKFMAIIDRLREKHPNDFNAFLKEMILERGKKNQIKPNSDQ
jgi:hypothetical protein